MSVDFNELVPDWSASCIAALESIKENAGRLTPAKVKYLCQQLDINVGQLQAQLVVVAQSFAIAPLSDFSVGCVALGNKPDNEGYPSIYLGANMEFTQAALNYTLHAEQSVTALVAAHNDAISSLLLNVTPCGMCRQLLHEFKANDLLPINIVNNKHTDLKQLLPEAFGPEDLGQARFSPPGIDLFNHKAIEKLASDTLEFAYAPHSGQAVGCIITMKSGRKYPGFNLESAAFNPGLNALIVSLIIARMSEQSLDFSELESLIIVHAQELACDCSEINEVKHLWRAIAPEKSVELMAVA